MSWVQVIIMVISYVVSSYQQKKAAQSAKRQQEELQRQADLMAAQSRGIMLNVEANDAPLPVIYGRRRVGGITCLKETAGSANRFLYKIVALGEGEIKGVINTYLDNVLSTDARFGALVGVQAYVGTDTQEANAGLIAALAGKWTAAHQGKGVAYVICAATWDDAAWQGEPTITCDVHGRLLYDPRDAGTSFSNNPALAIRDYLTNTRYGRGVASSAIDDTSFSAAANFCDERVAVPAHSETLSVVSASDTLLFAATPIFGMGDGVQFPSSAPAGFSVATTYYYIPVTDLTGKLASSYANALAGVALDITTDEQGWVLSHIDQARHQLDGVVDVEQTPLANVGMLLSACRGYLVYSAGLYKLKCDQAEAASGFAFTEDNIIGAWRIQSASRRDRYNRVTASFFNPARQWQPDFALFESAAYRAADNGLVLETQISLPYTANIYRALRHAQLECRQSRLGILVRFRATVDALRCEVGDVVSITHTTPGWVAKLFRIDALELRPDDEVDVFASEYDAGAYTLDALAEVRTAPVTNLPDPFTVATPGVPLVTEEVYETRAGIGVAAKAIVSWGNADTFAANYQVEHKLSADTAYTVMLVPRSTSAEILDIAPGTYDFRVKAINSLGISSPYATLSNKEIVGLSARPAAPVIRGLQAIGGMAVLTLDPHAELDVRRGGRWRIRHYEGDSPSASAWELSFSIGDAEGYVGDQTIIVLPLKAGSYLVKSEDALGQQSSAFAYIIVKQASLFAFTVNDTLTEDTAYTGAKDNVVAVDSLLKLDGAGLVDDIPDWDAISSLDDNGGVEASGTYTFADAFNFGAVTRVRLTGEIQGQTVNVNDLIDGRAANIDDWLDFDGSFGGGSADAWIEFRETDDNPSGAPTWSVWKRLDAAEATAWGVQCRLRMMSSDAAYNLHVNVLRVVAEEVV